MMKRLFDIFFSAIALIVLSPLIAITAIFVIIDLGFPIFFTQIRPGYRGNLFKIYKFRSMKDIVTKKGMQTPDIKRLTAFGLLIRSTSIDELPSLWNVLKGDMSLVGPRPLLVEYLSLYNKEQARRHNVKPGITGWAQVNGRNALSWRERFELDVWYVDNHTFFLDLKILLMTVKKVLFREGISESGQVTMSKFTGNTK
jgi:lipopolysaccharide/colanic/teichoic acid biosynthesis glycosyltransferase